MEQNVLAEMILTKFCHDIAGVVGAVQNGAELLVDSLDDRDFLGKAADALNQSAKVLSARLRFFRMAFGAAKDGFDGQAAAGLIQEYLGTLNGVQVAIEPFIAEDFALARIKMILALVAAETLTRGGKVTILADKVMADGINANIKEELRRGITGEEDAEPNPENAVGLFLYRFAKSTDYKIGIAQKQDSVVFSLK